jgi:hypothetical protein
MIAALATSLAFAAFAALAFSSATYWVVAVVIVASLAASTFCTETS